MSQSNIVPSKNENHSPPISTKKPLAFVQPVIRDFHSISNSSRKFNQNQIEKPKSSIQQELFSFVNQSRKFPMNKKTDLNHNEK
jgi:hypothetical protein